MFINLNSVRQLKQDWLISQQRRLPDFCIFDREEFLLCTLKIFTLSATICSSITFHRLLVVLDEYTTYVFLLFIKQL